MMLRHQLNMSETVSYTHLPYPDTQFVKNLIGLVDPAVFVDVLFL